MVAVGVLQVDRDGLGEMEGVRQPELDDVCERDMELQRVIVAVDETVDVYEVVTELLNETDGDNEDV